MDQSDHNNKPRTLSGASLSVVGRTPPHSIEAEEYLLSCCFLDGSDIVSRCIEARIGVDSFYLHAHGIIFASLLDLYNRQQPIDISVVAEELKTRKLLDQVGGYPFLTQISSRIPTTAQASYFIQKVRESALLRDVIRAATGAVEDCYNFSGEIDAFIDKVEANIFAVTEARVGDGAKHAKESAADAIGVIEKMITQKGALTGVPSGFIDLDRLTWGFQRQEMIILAARPSMGKTALALNFAEHAALPRRAGSKPTPVLVFSLEMGAAQLAIRMISSRAGVNASALREGRIAMGGDEMARLKSAAQELSRAPIYIDDSSALSVMQIRAKARRLHSRVPLGLIVVDYLQLLSPVDPRMPREQQVSEASRGLKALAKELDVPVIVLSQLNRSSEKESRTPRLSDLRESGSIEQDADVVMMLARPRDSDDKFQTAGDSAELIVAKQRNGPVGDLRLTFLRDITRFENFHA